MREKISQRVEELLARFSFHSRFPTHLRNFELRMLGRVYDMRRLRFDVLVGNY